MTALRDIRPIGCGPDEARDSVRGPPESCREGARRRTIRTTSAGGRRQRIAQMFR